MKKAKPKPPRPLPELLRGLRLLRAGLMGAAQERPGALKWLQARGCGFALLVNEVEARLAERPEREGDRC